LVSGRGLETSRQLQCLRAWAAQLAGRQADLEGDEALSTHGLGAQILAQTTADEARRTDLYLRDLAARAEHLAAELSALEVAADEPTREVGRRLGPSAEAVRGVAGSIMDAAEELGRTRARSR
jgi:hypothetical protein